MASLAPSSPRLPSPPPPAEIQLGPKPPSAGNMAHRQAQQMEQTAIDANSRRRIHPGTRSADMAAGPPLVPLSELDSAFQLQEHLAALHYHHTAANTNPVNRETAAILATPPPGIDRTLWLYELCRFLIEQCNGLIVGFLFDTPPCSAATCPEMRASEWQFLCAVHDQPKSCCAIDYCCHTLDWAANVVTNPQIFPSRFVALSDAHDKGAAVKNLVNVFRRLHRIFAHAWFQHRGVFWTVEGQTGLYVFFKTVCDMYDLLPSENYKLPPEAEGLEAPRAFAPSGGDPHQPPQQQHAQQTQQQHHLGMIQPTAIARPRSQGAPADADDDHLNAVSSRTSTRRHIRSSPSTGSAVTTVMEADEDENGAGDMASRFRHMRLVDPATPEDDPDAAEVPVIVEHMPEASHKGEQSTTNPAQATHDPAGVAASYEAGATPKEPASETDAMVAERTDPVAGSGDIDTVPDGPPEAPEAEIPVKEPRIQEASTEAADKGVVSAEASQEARDAPSQNAPSDADAGTKDPSGVSPKTTDDAEPDTEADKQDAADDGAAPTEPEGPQGEEAEAAQDPEDAKESGEAKEPTGSPQMK